MTTTPAEALRDLAQAIATSGPPPCRTSTDPDAWFDYRSDTTRKALALTGCRGCPVLDECRTYGITAGETYGIWGGTTPADRTTTPTGATS